MVHYSEKGDTLFREGGNTTQRIGTRYSEKGDTLRYSEKGETLLREGGDTTQRRGQTT